MYVTQTLALKFYIDLHCPNISGDSSPAAQKDTPTTTSPTYMRSPRC